MENGERDRGKGREREERGGGGEKRGMSYGGGRLRCIIIQLLILLSILSPWLHAPPIPVEYPKALPLLTLLTETNNFNQAGVWLKHGECLHMTQELEQAVISYAMVLSLAPHHTETRMTLASLYSQLGMTEEALELLDAGGCGLQAGVGVVCGCGLGVCLFSYINCTGCFWVWLLFHFCGCGLHYFRRGSVQCSVSVTRTGQPVIP